MAGFDFDAAIHWSGFDPQKTLARRADHSLPFIQPKGLSGPPLLLDNCVYIDQMQDRTPVILDQLVDARQASHSTVAIQELMHTVGVLNPADGRTRAVISEIRKRIAAMPAHRVYTPDPDVLGRAALLSGILCRLQDYAADSRRRALQDCVLFLQAQKLGFTVLTGNIADFDYLLQLLPAARVMFYRRR